MQPKLFIFLVGESVARFGSLYHKVKWRAHNFHNLAHRFLSLSLLEARRFDRSELSEFPLSIEPPMRSVEGTSISRFLSLYELVCFMYCRKLENESSICICIARGLSGCARNLNIDCTCTTIVALACSDTIALVS